MVEKSRQSLEAENDPLIYSQNKWKLSHIFIRKWPEELEADHCLVKTQVRIYPFNPMISALSDAEHSVQRH